HRTALAAAARHAATARAAAIIGAEVAATRQRIHSLKHRWIPTLEGAMAALDLALDEVERADGVRLRLATPPG
ncbi:MAG TPA: V-type ATP synthase subunit D, partial [Thermopolyspora sp.]